MSFYSETQLAFAGGLAAKTGSLITKKLPGDGNRVYWVEAQPTIEPVTVADLKTFARIDYDEEDDLLEGFITTVRQAAEEYTGRAFIEQTILMLMDFWPRAAIELPMPPLISVTKVFTLDEDDTETEYDSDNYYVSAPTGKVGRLILKQSVTEPVNTERDYGGYGIRFKAGYGDEAIDVPSSIRNGIMAWASVVQEMRTIDPKNPPPEVKGFLDPYRLITVMIR